MSTPRPVAVIILAAGEGTRMRSSVPKVLHRIGGRTLLGHALAAAQGTGSDRICVVVRHGRDRVAEHVAAIAPDVVLADQDETPGTGRAAQCALGALADDLEGTVLVTLGDVPLLTAATLTALTTEHTANGSAVTVATAVVPDPGGYGRVVRDDAGHVAAVVEDRDATPEQRGIREINAGIYAFDAGVLRSALADVGSHNAQGERYLTDVLAIARRRGLAVGAYRIGDTWQAEGVNDRVQLARLGAELNRRVVEGWMRAGVTVVDPATTWVDSEVRLGRDVTIHPQTQLHGSTAVADGATLGPDTTLDGVEVGAGAALVRTHAVSAVVGAGVSVGPYAYLRPGTELGEGAKVGTFVETKNASLGRGAKVPHLTYVGDASIGEGSNIGASSVFVNYNGVSKSRTTIGRHCRTGSDTMFVAPVTVGDGAYTGAGTVVRKDVPPGALALNVAPQRNLLGWVAEHRPGTPSADAAAAASVAPVPTSGSEGPR